MMQARRLMRLLLHPVGYHSWRLVGPEGGEFGAVMLATMAATGTLPYRCRMCGRMSLR